MNVKFKRGDKVGVAGIGGLGHLAIKLAVANGTFMSSLINYNSSLIGGITLLVINTNKSTAGINVPTDAQQYTLTSKEL